MEISSGPLRKSEGPARRRGGAVTVEQVAQVKEEATAAFAAKDFKLAAELWGRCIKALESASSSSPTSTTRSDAQSAATADAETDKEGSCVITTSVPGQPSQLPALYANRSAAHMSLHLFSEALADAEKVRCSEATPQTPRGSLVWLVHALTPTPTAGLMVQAVSLAPQWPKAFFRLGMAFAAKGLPLDACKAYRQSIQLRPEAEGDLRATRSRLVEKLFELFQVSRGEPQGAPSVRSPACPSLRGPSATAAAAAAGSGVRAGDQSQRPDAARRLGGRSLSR